MVYNIILGIAIGIVTILSCVVVYNIGYNRGRKKATKACENMIKYTLDVRESVIKGAKGS